jgi:DNA-binding FrmR family transcriptional regulator
LGHVVRERGKLLRRIRRIAGQVKAIERSLESEADCADVMLLLSATSGAMNSLMAEVVADHVRHHVLDSRGRPSASEARAAEEVIDVIKAFFR